MKYSKKDDDTIEVFSSKSQVYGFDGKPIEYPKVEAYRGLIRKFGGHYGFVPDCEGQQIHAFGSKALRSIATYITQLEKHA